MPKRGCSKPKRSKPILVLKTDNSNLTVRRTTQIEEIEDVAFLHKKPL
jgi:hypothetical protein